MLDEAYFRQVPKSNRIMPQERPMGSGGGFLFDRDFADELSGMLKCNLLFDD
jgi:hypothetical protein